MLSLAKNPKPQIRKVQVVARKDTKFHLTTENKISEEVLFFSLQMMLEL